MKKILIYIDSLNASGGIERIIFELLKHWVKQYKIYVLVKDEGKCFYGLLDDVSIDSINNPRTINMKNRLQRILMTFGNSLTSIKKIKNKRIIDFDYYYVTTPMNALELLLSGIDSRKIIVSEHGSAYGVNYIYKMVKHYVYPKVNCVSVPNKMDVEHYNTYGVNAIYVPHLVYLKGKEMNSLCTKVVLNCGRLTADKRQLELLDIWKNIMNKNGWKLVIIGDGEEKDNLINYIKNNNLENTVELLPARRDIETIYKNASIFAFTSRFEGFGLVLVEAMSYGIPCIAFDCPSGPRDIILEGKNGFLVENGNYEQFSKKLELFMNLDKEELKVIGKNAYDFINNWENDMILEKWQQIFK